MKRYLKIIRIKKIDLVLILVGLIIGERSKVRVSRKFIKLFGIPREKEMLMKIIKIAAALQFRFQEAYKKL